MISLLLLSHSPKIVEGVRDLALEMASGSNLIAIGGTKDGKLGTDFDRVFAALQTAAEAGEVIVLADLGSACMTGEMAREALESALQERVFLSNAALVEGGLIAAVCIAGGGSAREVLIELNGYELDK